MIDISNTVLSQVATALDAVFGVGAITISAETFDAHAAFPCVTVQELSNTTYRRSLDNESTEHHANIEYQIDVYSNKASGGKTQARNIAKTIDSTMLGNKFTRTFMQPLPNLDNTIYRITMRYTAVVAAGVVSGNNTVYQIYRE